jgi:hypothetical protein
MKLFNIDEDTAESLYKMGLGATAVSGFLDTVLNSYIIYAVNGLALALMIFVYVQARSKQMKEISGWWIFSALSFIGSHIAGELIPGRIPNFIGIIAFLVAALFFLGVSEVIRKRRSGEKR